MMTVTSKKTGIFGGSFNPLHRGHLNSMFTVANQLKLDAIRVVPSFQSPNKNPIQGSTPDQRYEMVRRGVSGREKILKVDNIEVQRGGVSYTIDTLESFIKAEQLGDLYLIIGADQFEKFDQWKDFRKILMIANLVVTSRPGRILPEKKEDFPLGVASFVTEFTKNKAELNTGKKIYFIQLEDVEVSASEIRNKIRMGESVEELVPSEVIEYINEEHLYESLDNNIEDFEELTRFCADQLFLKKAINVRGWDLRGLTKPSEFSIVASATSRKHTVSLAENIVRQVKTMFHVYPQHIEGKSEGNWVLLDYGSLIIHIFYDYTRLEFNIEELMLEGQDMKLLDPTLNKTSKE